MNQIGDDKINIGEIIDVYEGKDPQRNAYFQLEKNRREVLGDSYKLEDLKNHEDLIKQEEQKEILSLYPSIKAILKKYMDMSEYAYHIVTLWIIGTYVYDKFSTFPLLFINAVRGSGKTRLLKLIETLSFNGKIQANLSESVVFRSKKKHTMLIDEFEQVGSKESNTLRELINASYKKGARVERMKEVTRDGKKDYDVEGFDLYSPLAMANIWGMDETVRDRCLIIQLDKSDNQIISKLLEDFGNNKNIQSVKMLLLKHSLKLCSYVDNVAKSSLGSVMEEWNNYILSKSEGNLSTLTTLVTLSTLSTLFDKIDKIGVYGRDLELFFPLFILSDFFGETVLNETLEYSKSKFKEKNLDEFTENPDVILLDFIWKNYQDIGMDYVYLSDIKGQYQMTANLKELDTRTLSKALERLNIVLDKTRDNRGVKVMFDLVKVNSKLRRYNGTQTTNTSQVDGGNRVE